MKIVLPGEVIARKPVRTLYSFVEKGSTYAAVIGALDEERERFIPLKGPYLPMVGDRIVGIVEDEKVVGYGVDILCPYKGMIMSRGLRTTFAPGDVVAAEIAEVSEVRDVDLIRPRKLIGGRVVAISPMKVMRVIGHKSSMLEILRSLTGCEIFVGKNGAIWVKGRDEQAAIDAIMKIDREAHTRGLTERIKAFLSTRK